MEYSNSLFFIFLAILGFGSVGVCMGAIILERLGDIKEMLEDEENGDN